MTSLIISYDITEESFVEFVTVMLSSNLLIRGGFKKFEEKCCQICNCHWKFTFSVHVVN